MKRYLLCSLIISLGLSVGAVAYAAPNECRAVFDAGSSGSRLFIFEKQNEKWISHKGPLAPALADPIRETSGNSWRDVDALISSTVNMLEAIKNDGVDSQGQIQWQAFDWTQRCQLQSISVYATAGMRIAEQQYPQRAQALWEKLKATLKTRYPGIAIQAHTLTGFEEGLFAWMTLNQLGKGENYGLMEMGGASTQVVFVCADCTEAKPIWMNGRIVPVFSYSFLGQGAVESLTTMGAQALKNPACAFAAGQKDPDWNAELCAATIPLMSANGITDPYDYGPDGQGTAKVLPEQIERVANWYLAGSLQFYTDDDIEKYCVRGEPGFQPDTACFRSVYLRKFLDLLAIKQHQSTSTSWTLGAVTCDDQNCLVHVPVRECNWLPEGCLAELADDGFRVAREFPQAPNH